jgi:tetratricopeptide (TPR) repeat protein
MGDRNRALNAYEWAIELSDGDPRIKAASLNNQAFLAWDDAESDKAEALFREASRLAHDAGDRAGEGRSLSNLIELYLDDYRLDEMRLLLLDSSPLLIANLGEDEAADLLGRCSQALTIAGRGEEAAEMVEQIIGRYASPRAGKRNKEARLLLVLTRALRERGRSDQALAVANRGLRTRCVSNDPTLKARFLLEKSMVLESTGQLEEALSVLDLAEEVLSRQQLLAGQLAVALRKGIIEDKRGNRSRAQERYRQASLQAERLGDRLALARSSENLGRALDPGSEERERSLRRAMDIYSSLGMLAKVNDLRHLVEGA